MSKLAVYLVCALWLQSACGQPPPEVTDAGSSPDARSLDRDPLHGKLVLNELFAAPGSQDDWVELYNKSEEPIDLTGVTVTVSPLAISHETTVAVPTGVMLDADRFLLIDKDLSTPANGEELSCARPFQLPDNGFELRLIGASGAALDTLIIDAERAAALRPGISLGHSPDGEGEFELQTRPTPENHNAGTNNGDPCLEPPGPGEFDDHTTSCIGSVDSFFWLAGSRAGTTITKFDIVNFQNPDTRAPIFLDSVFYSVHDEWYYFRMLNGQAFPGETLYEPYPGTFDTIEDIYAWARAEPDLPHDDTFLSWSGERLYSRRFYDLAIRTHPRPLGAGVLMHVPARTVEPVRDEFWGFELEYSDLIDPETLAVYFEVLAESLPPEIADNVHWVIRSPFQENIARQMEQQGLPYHDRITRYTELSVPGETQVYNSGLVAGRVRIVRAGEPGIENATTTDILVLEEIPDYLPPCQALITTVPQTPLSHISILAESRGIPNLYVGDLTNDPAWDQWGRIRARLALHAQSDGTFEAVALTTDQYNTWRDLLPDNDKFVPQVDMETAPYTLELNMHDPSEMDALRPLIGGKSAGFLSLLHVPGLEAPDDAMAITVRAYHEHLQPMRAAWLDELLARVEFRYLSHRQFRFLVLEGIEEYDEKYQTSTGQTYKQTVLSNYPAGTTIGDLIRAGGVRTMIESTPIDSVTLATLEAALQTRFDHLSTTQGLRFRSSSNVEDIEGFNGAGLYESNTGYLSPAVLPDPDDHDKTVESALLRTWSSYWSWEAYDERLTANVDHLSGNMGILVHARFDNDVERANGVLTMTRYPETSPTHAPELFGDRYEMTINAQAGSLSVTNPPPGECVLPEVARVRIADGEQTPRIERLQSSTETPDNTQILSDTAIVELFRQAVQVTDIWLDSENAPLSAEQQRRTVTVDFEFRSMDAGWPDIDMGVPFDMRMIVKQARSLDPSISDAPTEVANMPIPRDVLARARTVTRRVCTADRFTLTVVEAATDPLARPNLGHDVSPFTALIELDVTGDIPELGWSTGHRVDAVHTDLASFSHPGPLAGQDWNLMASVDDARQPALNLSSLSFHPNGSWLLENTTGTATGTANTCTVETLYSTPDNYLLSILAGEL